MKIRWEKIAPSVYRDDTGRWTVFKYSGGILWWILDNQSEQPDKSVSHKSSLKEAKLFVDQQIEREAINV